MEGTLRFRSEAVDPASGEPRPCCVLVDSGSSINITRPWCLGATRTHEHPLTIRALKQELLVDRCGEVVLMLPTGNGSGTREPVGFECHELDQVGPPSLGIDVLRVVPRRHAGSRSGTRKATSTRSPSSPSRFRRP